MLTHAIPRSFRELLDEFQDCFTKPGFENFSIMSIGWIMCIGSHSISRVIQAADVVRKGKHHSTLYRFFSKGAWEVDSVAKVIFRLLLPFLPKEITILVDDTLSHKSGPHIFGTAMHYDSHMSTYGRGTSAGSKAFFAFGHNWVIAAIWVPLPWKTTKGLAIPFLFRLYRSKRNCPKKKYRKRTEIAEQMIALVNSWLPEGRQLHIVADSEYACKTIVRELPKGVVFTGPMSMDAALYEQPGDYQGRGRPQCKGKRLPSPSELARSRTPWTELTLAIYGKEVDVKVKTMICLWYTVAGAQLVRMVVTRDPSGRINDRAYFTTNPKTSVEELISQFARRWEIEVAFRNMKQSLGLQDPQNGWWRRPSRSPRPRKRPGPNSREKVGEKAVNHTLALVFSSYALNIIWYLRHGIPEEDVAWARAEAKWYLHKVHPSYNDMLAAMRKELWMARLSQHPLGRLGREIIALALPHWKLAG